MKKIVICLMLLLAASMVFAAPLVSSRNKGNSVATTVTSPTTNDKNNKGNPMCHWIDTNDSGDIDQGDLGFLLSKYGDKNCGWKNQWCGHTDLNFNGRVEHGDISILRGWYGIVC